MTIGDCGLPVPSGVKKIDLALRFGQPSFIDVVSEVAKYMKIEKIYVAPEMEKENPKQWKAMHEVFPETEVEWVIYVRRGDKLHPLQHFDTALRLLGLGGLRAEAVDITL